MGVMSTLNSIMKKPLLTSLKELLTGVEFKDASNFYWSPQRNTIYMNSQALAQKEGQWALLHEAGHATKGHERYQTDAGLLILEVEAWSEAEELAMQLGLSIPPEHVQDCLDTYRDWLYARSTCPKCTLNSLQVDETTYLCLNCSTRWSVSHSRFCRAYRMQERHKKTPSEANQTVFAEKARK